MTVPYSQKNKSKSGGFYAVRDEIVKLLDAYGYTPFVTVKTAGVP